MYQKKIFTDIASSNEVATNRSNMFIHSKPQLYRF
jgi:hypothetical protein